MGLIYQLTLVVIIYLFILFCSPNAAKLHFIRAKTKLILELTIIDIQIDFNCRKNKISVNMYTVPLFCLFSLPLPSQNRPLSQ